MKFILTILTIIYSDYIFSQVPAYVPINGLVGWWPFNGNANDESGNGYNGVVNGVISSIDRFGASNSAYNFDGVDDFIEANLGVYLDSGVTYAGWALTNLPNDQFSHKAILWLRLSGPSGNPPIAPNQASGMMINTNGLIAMASDGFSLVQLQDTSEFCNTNSWTHVVFTYNVNTGIARIYVNGIETLLMQGQSLLPINMSSNTLKIGKDEINGYGNRHWMGSLDDIGIWNRALTDQEIMLLYQGCQLGLTTQPQDVNVATSTGVVNFSVVASSQQASYQWQTNLGLGFQNISNAGQYLGANSSNLSVSNLTMSNNNQVFRCIVTDGTCGDTSNSAILTIIDDAGLESIGGADVHLQPNPTNGEFSVNVPTNLAGELIRILSIDGSTLITLIAESANQRCDLRQLSSGCYWVQVGSNKPISFIKN